MIVNNYVNMNVDEEARLHTKMNSCSRMLGMCII